MEPIRIDVLEKKHTELVEKLKQDMGTKNFIGLSVADCLADSRGGATMKEILEVREKMQQLEREAG